MANATARVGKRTIRNNDEFIDRSAETLSAETIFYVNAFVGTDATGYYCKGDDSQAWTFSGVVRGREGNPKLPAGTAGDGTIELGVHQPLYLEVGIAAVAVTDIGKKVYALFDQTVTLDSSATTYANLVGVIAWVESGVTTACWVKPNYDGVAGNGASTAAKFLAATGAQTLSKMDLNKTIFVPSTAAYALTLPPVADTQAGDFLRFVKTTSNAAAITLTGNAAETIDGSNTLNTVDAQYDTATLVSTGLAWIVVSRDIT